MPEVARMEGGSGSEPVQLQPFIHQVGGHTSMLQYDSTTLCKPCIPREQSFYNDMPNALKQFAPEFRGVIDVELHEDSEGYITLVGYPSMAGSRKASKLTSTSPVSSGSETDSPDINGRVPQSTSSTDTSYCVRLLRSGSIEVKDQTQEVFEDPTSESGKTGNSNQWRLKCHKRWLSKMRKTLTKDSQSCQFILLENVAAKFRHPCILDLKMGTRVHGDEVTEAKKQRHMMKCSNSTSLALGARICGMQVYHPNTGTYVCQNKYYGRKLNVEGFKQTLQQFLYNGSELRTELTGPIVQRLKQLTEQISQQDSFRFYSSSLLIMYDGQVPYKSRSDSTGEESTSDSLSADESSSENSLNIEVRMIDFAHSTYSGFQDDCTIHKGPDDGYLFGLKNLIELFSDVR